MRSLISLISVFPDSYGSKYFLVYLSFVKLIILRCGINLINLTNWTGVFMMSLENHATFDLSHRCHTSNNIQTLKVLTYNGQTMTGIRDGNFNRLLFVGKQILTTNE